MYVHLTIRVQRLTIALSEHAVASWLWSRLRRTFPAALAAIIMPNHLPL
ncbi:MAG: hypothetical protein HY744_21490, partial [Deltaproteobacteria bacterium]|nr:hypothetical protein [Deltaproteobacteria bacterium]